MTDARLVRAWMTIGEARAIVERWEDGEISAGQARRRLIYALRMMEIPGDEQPAKMLLRIPSVGEAGR